MAFVTVGRYLRSPRDRLCVEPRAVRLSIREVWRCALQRDDTHRAVDPMRRWIMMTMMTSLGLLPLEARAFCGRDIPYWAHYVDFQEGLVDVGKREIVLRVLGNEKKEAKAKVLPVVIIPDAGLSSAYLEGLSALAEDNRRIIFIDSLGSGQAKGRPVSNSVEDLVAAGVLEVKKVLDLLDVKKAHFLGHGFGAAIVAAFSIGQPSSVASVVLESPVLAGPFPTTVSVTDLLGPGKRQICAADSLRGVNMDAFNAVYSSKGWNLMKEADKVAQPVMIISGKKDPVGLWTENGNNAKIIGESHSPHLDKIEEFAATILSFYNASEQ